MRYLSTRDASISRTFEEALLAGYAPDGGLFVPDHIPKLKHPAETLQAWAALDYPTLAQTILRRFVSPEEVSNEELASVCEFTYAGFANPAHPVPVVPVTESLSVAELWHGPTFCFKDLGMRGVICLLGLFATKRNQPVTLVISTTGDTGPAAVQAVADLHHPLLSILVHYPEGQISELQQRQLTTVDSPRVRIAAFQGSGDDMDQPIKNILSSSTGEVGATKFTGVNSYNIGRPLLQTVHYIWTYLRVVPFEDLPKLPTVDIVLPTGAMGNIVSGYMAKLLGVPLGRLCAGVNENDIVDRAFRSGAFHKSSAMVKTLSDAINIQVPYNFERLVYYAAHGSHETVKALYEQMEQTNKMDLDEVTLQNLQENCASAKVTDKEVCATIVHFYETYGYMADPHTAVGLCAANKLGYPDTVAATNGEATLPAVVLATASPCKFQESVTAALGPEKWKAYMEGDKFPAAARALMETPERPPAVYKADPTKSLQENQATWEAMALALAKELDTRQTL